MKRKHIAMLLPLAAMILTTGCSGEEITITIQNLAESGISEIRVSPESDKSEIPDILKETLPNGEEITVSLGKFTEEELQEGFYFEVYNADDDSSGTFNMLMLSEGDTLSFYIDDWGLAAAVNMTEEEIAEQKARDHADYLDMAEEEAAVK